MNSTVWLEQINRGLKDYIQSIVKLKNDIGEFVSIPVYIRKPDEDFKVEDYPMITLYNLSIGKRDEQRYYPFKVPRVFNYDTGKVSMERTAVPYSLMYQIDLWSVLQHDMDKLSSIWEFELGRTFNLPVTDSGGNFQTAMCLQKGDGVKKVDKLSSSDRVFCMSFTYLIWAELDEEINIGDESDLVKEVIINDKSILS